MKRKQIDRRLVTILLIVFVQMVGAAMIMPILPLYAKREFDMSPQTITLLGTAFFAAQFIAGPFLGRLSDNYGRLPVLIVSQIGTAVSFLMLAFAPSAGFLFAARLLDGITGGNIIVAQAYITDITPKERRTESLGLVFAVFGIGFVIGPALGGILAAAFGPRIPYIIASIAATIVVILTRFTLEETVTPDKQAENRQYKKENVSPLTIVRNSSLLLILIIAFVGQFALGLLQATFALYGEAVLFAGYDESAINLGIGLLLAVIGVGQFVTQAFLLRRFLRRFGEGKLIILGSVLRTIGLFLLAATTIPLVGAFSGIFFAVGMGLMMPSLQSLATVTVGEQLRGGILGIYQSTISLSTIVSTAVAGVIFAINPTIPFWIGGSLSLIVILPALFLLKNVQVTKQPITSKPSTAD